MTLTIDIRLLATVIFIIIYAIYWIRDRIKDDYGFLFTWWIIPTIYIIFWIVYLAID